MSTSSQATRALWALAVLSVVLLAEGCNEEEFLKCVAVANAALRDTPTVCTKLPDTQPAYMNCKGTHLDDCDQTKKDNQKDVVTNVDSAFDAAIKECEACDHRKLLACEAPIYTAANIEMPPPRGPRPEKHPLQEHLIDKTFVCRDDVESDMKNASLCVEKEGKDLLERCPSLPQVYPQGYQDMQLSAKLYKYGSLVCDEGCEKSEEVRMACDVMLPGFNASVQAVNSNLEAGKSVTDDCKKFDEFVTCFQKDFATCPALKEMFELRVHGVPNFEKSKKGCVSAAFRITQTGYLVVAMVISVVLRVL